MPPREFDSPPPQTKVNPQSITPQERKKMEQTRKNTAVFLSSVVFLVLACIVVYGLLYASGITLFVLLAIAKCIGLIAFSIVCGVSLFFLISVVIFICGVEDTFYGNLVNKVKLRVSKRKPKKKKTPKSTSSWGSIADDTLKVIGKRVKKLKPGNLDTLNTLVSFCKEKVTELSLLLVKGDKTIQDAAAFVEYYEKRKPVLEELKNTTAQELQETKTEDTNPLACSMRSMKAAELLEIQNQLRLLESKKRHHTHMAGMVNSTRLLIMQSKMAVETVLEELKLKKEREEILGA